MGRFIIERRLSTNNSKMYVGYDPTLKRRVCLEFAPLGDEGPTSAFATSMIAVARKWASVSHAQIARVYDVGLVADELYIASELVEDPSLEDWLQKPRANWQAAVRHMVEVAEALANLHARGLAHGAISPRSVRIGNESGARLVGCELEASRRIEQTSVAPAQTPHKDAVLFCSLLDKVFRAPKFIRADSHLRRLAQIFQTKFNLPHHTPRTLMRLVAELQRWSTQWQRHDQSGEPVNFPACIATFLDPDVPTNMSQVFEAIALALAAQLEKTANRGQRWLGWAAAGSMALASAAAVPTDADAPNHCDSGRDRVHHIWNDRTAEVIADRFANSGLHYAADVATRVNEILNQRATAWLELYEQTCQAKSTDDDFDLRMACLNQSLAESSALVESLTNATAETVAQALTATHAQTQLHNCSEPKLMRERQLQPVRPREIAATATMRSLIARLRAYTSIGNFSAVESLRTKFRNQLEHTTFVPAKAEAHLAMGGYETLRGEYTQAVEHLNRALELATSSSDDRVTAQASTGLAFVHGYHWQNHAVGHELLALADATIASSGRPLDLRANYTQTEAVLVASQGDLAAAEPLFSRSIELRIRASGGRTPESELAQLNLAITHHLLGNYGTALDLLHDTLDSLMSLVGPKHPRTTEVNITLAEIYFELGQPRAALEHIEPALHNCKDDAESRRTPCVENRLSQLRYQVAAGETTSTWQGWSKIAAAEKHHGGRLGEHLVWADTMAAHLALETGEYQRALDLARQGWRRLQDEMARAPSPIPPYPRFATLRTLTRALLKTGDIEGSWTTLQRADEVRRDLPFTTPLDNLLYQALRLACEFRWRLQDTSGSAQRRALADETAPRIDSILAQLRALVGKDSFHFIPILQLKAEQSRLSGQALETTIAKQRIAGITSAISKQTTAAE